MLGVGEPERSPSADPGRPSGTLSPEQMHAENQRLLRARLAHAEGRGPKPEPRPPDEDVMGLINSLS